MASILYSIASQAAMIKIYFSCNKYPQKCIAQMYFVKYL